jgi:hypothetical protein
LSGGIRRSAAKRLSGRLNAYSAKTRLSGGLDLSATIPLRLGLGQPAFCGLGVRRCILEGSKEKPLLKPNVAVAEAVALPEPFAVALLVAVALPGSENPKPLALPVAVAEDIALPEPFAVALLVPVALPPGPPKVMEPWGMPASPAPPVAADAELLEPFETALLVAVASPPFPAKPADPTNWKSPAAPPAPPTALAFVQTHSPLHHCRHCRQRHSYNRR